MLPGTMFAPSPTEGGDGRAARQLRIAFANVGVEGLSTRSASASRRLGTVAA